MKKIRNEYTPFKGETSRTPPKRGSDLKKGVKKTNSSTHKFIEKNPTMINQNKNYGTKI